MQNAYTGQTAALSPLDFAAPDIAVQQRQLQRQQQLAELLRAQALQSTGGTEMVGGWAIPNSPVKPLEKLAQALMARHVQGQADEQETALAQSRSQALAQALNGGNGGPDVNRGLTLQAFGAPPEVVTQAMLGSKNKTMVVDQGGQQTVVAVPERGNGPAQTLGGFGVSAKPDTVLTVDSRERVAGEDRKSREGIAAAGNATSMATAGISANTAMRGQDMSAETAKASQALEALKSSPEYQAMTATAKAQAEAKAAALQALPEVEAGGARASKLVDELLKHPGLDKTVGSIPGTLMQYKPGSDQADFKARLDEIKGGSFLQAINSLRGTGQITEVEGAKATAAINRMNTSQSKAEFVKAAEEFKQVIDSGVKRGQAKAGAPVTGVPASPVDALLEKYK